MTLVTRHMVLILFWLETYNLYSIASQVKRLFDPVTIGISPPGGHAVGSEPTNISYAIAYYTNEQSLSLHEIRLVMVIACC